ncbi:MAG: metalloregulator ArsR/SmtB family transcription factor, partial [Gammaproteobacteria bacterium]|nr:metalloregulator ArsR/SmtB family transcription factor [Gammaproteobacteria bacterium]
RLMILCHLADGEKSVGELVDLLNMPQSSLSQHLARMRAENLVETRRESQAVYYRLENDSVRKLIVALYDIYCH